MNREELTALPEWSVVSSASGIVYQKVGGRWKGPSTSRGVSSSALTDPEFTRQPVTVLREGL